MLNSPEINKNAIMEVIDAALDLQCFSCEKKCERLQRLLIAAALLRQSGIKPRSPTPLLSPEPTLPAA